MTESERKAIEAKIDKDLTASKMSEAQKQAIRERLTVKAQELSETRAIRGLDTKTGKHREKITLGNGLTVNADAFEE